MPVYNRIYLDENKRISPQGLFDYGAKIKVEISGPHIWEKHLIESGKPIPKPICGDAIIDTGATYSAVDIEILQELGIHPIDVLPDVFVSYGSQKREIYPAKFSFPGTQLPPKEFSTVLSGVYKPTGFIALIGRDFLSNFIFIYNGPLGSFSLSG